MPCNPYKRPRGFAEGGVTGDDSWWNLTKGLVKGALSGGGKVSIPTSEELAKSGPVLQGYPGPASLMGLAESVLQSMSAQDRAQHPERAFYGGYPILGSYIPTSRNLDEFNARKAAAAKALTEVGGHSPEAVEALSYLKTRYPNRMKVVPDVYPDPDLLDNLAARGVFNEGHEGLPNPDGTPDTVAPTIGYSPKGLSGPSKPWELVGTLGHETQHGVDNSRWTPDQWLKAKAPQRYSDRPIEIRAGKAGDTAITGYNKYQALMLPEAEQEQQAGRQQRPLTGVGAAERTARRIDRQAWRDAKAAGQPVQDTSDLDALIERLRQRNALP